MKKMLITSLLLLSLDTFTAKLKTIDYWSGDSTFNVGLSTAVGAAIPFYIAHWWCGGIKDVSSKLIVGGAGALGGLIGYTIAYYHTPEVRFNQALAILQDEQNEYWFSLFEEAQAVAVIWAVVDERFFETKYPRVSGMKRIEGLYNSLGSCINMLEKAMSTESGRSAPNTSILKYGKSLIERAQGYLIFVKRWIMELRNDKAYLMQNSAHASEMAAIAARQAALNSSIAAMNSGNHYHYHRY